MPILYSFRRCPYAIRARMALAYAGQAVEMREIIFRDKPAHMLECSPKGTVPVLVLEDGRVIEESFDVMQWALGLNDPEGWLLSDRLPDTHALIESNDEQFKPDLDLYKYSDRHPEGVGDEARVRACAFLRTLDQRLVDDVNLFGDRRSLGDVAVFPFVRQFAHVDREWFYAQDWPHLLRWLDGLLESELFRSVMHRYPVWAVGTTGPAFPPQ